MRTQSRQAITRRQEAVRLAGEGFEIKAIAGRMGLNPETIASYLSLERSRETHLSNAEQYRRFLDDATAAVEEAKDMAVKLHLGIVTHAGLNCATEGLRVSRHGEALTKRARGAGLNGEGL